MGRPDVNTHEPKLRIIYEWLWSEEELEVPEEDMEAPREEEESKKVSLRPVTTVGDATIALPPIA